MLKFLFASLLLLPFFAETKEKICLNMIVKDESRVITRCLDSVMPIIDYWVIVDTGSTDGTQEIIKKHLKNIPGKLYERPWRNFGENRSEAFELAKGKGDYILFMDADDTLEFQDGFQLPPLTFDLYNMWRGSKGFSYHKPQLVKGNLPWKWVGVTHEYLDCEQPHTSTLLNEVRYVSGDGGASTYDPNKFLKNVKLLEDGLKKEPDNSRYAFYLAESYRDAGEKGKALERYQKRVKMGGWDEEVFWSKFQIAQMMQNIGLPDNIVIEALLDAHNFRPHRVEPIYSLAEIYNRQGKHSQAYEILKARDFIAKPAQKDILFNMDWMEEYGVLFQLSICSYYLGHYQESLDASNKLIGMKNVPEDWRKLADANRTFPQEKLQLATNPKTPTKGPAEAKFDLKH
jgi:glycosyltransferase involved in cell wall biosynthesis